MTYIHVCAHVLNTLNPARTTKYILDKNWLTHASLICLNLYIHVYIQSSGSLPTLSLLWMLFGQLRLCLRNVNTNIHDTHDIYSTGNYILITVLHKLPWVCSCLFAIHIKYGFDTVYYCFGANFAIFLRSSQMYYIMSVCISTFQEISHSLSLFLKTACLQCFEQDWSSW